MTNVSPPAFVPPDIGLSEWVCCLVLYTVIWLILHRGFWFQLVPVPHMQHAKWDFHSDSISSRISSTLGHVIYHSLALTSCQIYSALNVHLSGAKLVQNDVCTHMCMCMCVHMYVYACRHVLADVLMWRLEVPSEVHPQKIPTLLGLFRFVLFYFMCRSVLPFICVHLACPCGS